jgi:hypothetical protein
MSLALVLLCPACLPAPPNKTNERTHATNTQSNTSYHGFRFVEIAGLSSPPQAELLHFHSDVAKRAQANFSSPTLNRILTMAVGSQHSNMMCVFVCGCVCFVRAHLFSASVCCRVRTHITCTGIHPDRT